VDALTFQLREKNFYAKPACSELRLPEIFYEEASTRIKNSERKFGIAIADEEMIGFFEALRPDFYKVLSQDIKNYSLIDLLIGKTDKPIFISTGMSDLDEISDFLAHIGQHKGRVRLIHTQLTQNPDQVNLKAIEYLRRKFSLPVAYGHHCANLNVLYLSLAFSPSDIFFYVKGEQAATHPDDEHAVFLDDIVEVVENLKKLPVSIGSESKSKMENDIEKKWKSATD
jgi:sialic acid synthase SpsE